MSNSSRKSQEGGAKVPAYIVTFSDMVTLLLTFFVMLLSLAKVQDPELFNQSRDSFIESIEKLGLGTLFGPHPSSQFENEKQKFQTDSEGTPPGRMIDPEQERLRQSIKNMSELVRDSQNNSVYRKNILSTGILFDTGNYQLNNANKASLDAISQNLRKSTGQVSLYLIGLPDDNQTDIVLGSQRAQEASLYLKDSLNSPTINIVAMGVENSWLTTIKNSKGSHLWILISNSGP